MRFVGWSLALGLTLAPVVNAAAGDIHFGVEWTYSHGGDEALAEIPAYDAVRDRLFVVGETGVTVLDATSGTFVDTLAVTDATSVAVFGDMVAVAVPDPVSQNNGTVRFYNAANLAEAPMSVNVGALPDMVTFNNDGTKVLVANEGEPNDAYDNDPVGSVSIVDVATKTVTTAGFGAFDKNDPALANLRVFGANDPTLAQDVEPEYIAISADNTTAYVTLQEANGIAIVDIATSTVTEIVPLGFKDHSQVGNGLDPSDRDDASNDGINIATYDNLFGMYQPDAIASYMVDGKTYLVIANEGDARDYDGFSEEERVKDLDLDPTAFPDSSIQDDDRLGRLQVTTTLGDIDNDGDYDELYVYGGRSYSILDETGTMVYDSGDMIEQIIAGEFPELWQDGRSDNKGPEPEGVTVGYMFDRWIAFIGLERTSMVMMFDITDPDSPFYVDTLYLEGDVSPEGLAFFYRDGDPYLAVANEVSSTTTLYSFEVPEPATLALLGAGIGALAVGSRRRRSKAE